MNMDIRSLGYCLPAALLVALGGCSASSSGTAAASAPARKAPAARSIPTDAARRKTAGATGQPTAADSAASTCGAGEQILFACTIEGTSKSATLCMAGGANGGARYRFGAPSHAELVYPAAPDAGATFNRTALTFAGGTGGYAYSFRNGPARYALYSVSGDDGLARSGVAVLDAAGREVADRHCDPGTLQETDSLDLIRRTRAWPSDSDVAAALH